MATPASASAATSAATPIDYLDEDVITVPGQAYALVSFVSPQANQKADKCAMKIRGVFGSRDEASAHVKKLMRVDNSFDIFLVEMYKWVPVSPDPNDIQDQEYSDAYLNQLMRGYQESQLAAKQFFAERKREVIEQGLDTTLTPEERIPPPPEGVPTNVFTDADPHPSTSTTSGQ